jgi:hypothetical protein
MTRRKDPQPEAEQPQDLPKSDPAAAEPFVVTDPPEPPPPPHLTEPPPPPQPQVIVRRGSFVAPIVGGALAAIGGFALSHFDVLGLATSVAPVDLAPLAAQIDDMRSAQATAADKLSTDLTALGDRITTLETAPGPDVSGLAALDQRLSAIETMPTDGTASTAAMTARIATLEERITSLPTGGSDHALQQKLDAALAQLAEAEAAATARAAEAEASANASARAMALDALSAAVASGQPFAAELQALADPALTGALGPLADTGAPTLAQLQEAFPYVARNALSLSREQELGAGWGERFVDFLASQTGARSLTPLEGDTPDAVLSRAEFALSEGRVAEALTEIQALDPAIRASLDGWIAQAEVHQSAASALQAARGE